jgi:hypothetical protein
MEVLSTSDYKQFKYLKYNRPIDHRHVDKIKTSISYKNLLMHKPILVSKDHYVVDGQHRLEAAKALGIPIFYSICDINPASSVEDLVVLQTAKKWILDDYLKAHVKDGKKEYAKLLDIMETNKLSLHQCLMFIKGGRRTVYSSFKDGKMELEDIHLIESKIRYLKEFVDYLKEKQVVSSSRTWIRSKSFAKAFFMLFDQQDFDFKLFMKKIPYGISRMRPCASFREYYTLFASIYNYRSRNQIDEEINE